MVPGTWIAFFAEFVGEEDGRRGRLGEAGRVLGKSVRVWLAVRGKLWRAVLMDSLAGSGER